MRTNVVRKTEIHAVVRRKQPDGTMKVVYEGVLAQSEPTVWERLRSLIRKLVKK